MQLARDDFTSLQHNLQHLLVMCSFSTQTTVVTRVLILYIVSPQGTALQRPLVFSKRFVDYFWTTCNCEFWFVVSMFVMYCRELYCTAFPWVGFCSGNTEFCSQMYCTKFYCTAGYCNSQYELILYFIELYGNAWNGAVMHETVLWNMEL